MVPSRPRLLRLAAWSAFLAFTLRLLHGSAFGELSIPLGSWADLSAWIEEAPPVVMAVALVRLAALAGAWYLAIATVLLTLADAAGWRRLARVLATLAPPIVRHVASRAAGAGLAAGALVAAAPMPHRFLAAPVSASPSPAIAPASRGLADVEVPPGSATMIREATGGDGHDPGAGAVAAGQPGARAIPAPGDLPRSTATMTRWRGGTDEPLPHATATMVRRSAPVPDDAPGAAATTVTGPAGAVHLDPGHPGCAGETASCDTHATDGSWIVDTGDSLWSIAAETLRERHPGASDREVARYWSRLLEANRARLVDPGNPDLLVPGQELEVVPVDP